LAALSWRVESRFTGHRADRFAFAEHQSDGLSFEFIIEVPARRLVETAGSSPDALEAVRQWEYTPTFVNGEAVPIIMTVTVSFILR
jgi:hypothetical protein